MNGKILILAFCLVAAFGLVTTVGIAGPKGLKACRDTIDNDGDNYIDWPDDPGCDSRNDDNEYNPWNDSCSDTDGGNIITVFGTTFGYYNDELYSNSDYCVDSGTIMEYYCSGNYEQSQQQGCGTDGYGSNYCSSGDVYRDYIDYYCTSGACDSTSTPELVEECTYGCTDGVCDGPPDSCSDTDGGFVVENQGTASGYYEGSPYNHTDYCVDSTNIVEYYCVGDWLYDSGSMPCWINNQTATCVDGSCTL
jgi:hypothetical protein